PRRDVRRRVAGRARTRAPQGPGAVRDRGDARGPAGRVDPPHPLRQAPLSRVAGAQPASGAGERDGAAALGDPRVAAGPGPPDYCVRTPVGAAGGVRSTRTLAPAVISCPLFPCPSSRARAASVKVPFPSAVDIPTVNEPVNWVPGTAPASTTRTVPPPLVVRVSGVGTRTTGTEVVSVTV